MLLKNSIININEFFLISLNQIRKFYLKSTVYDKKISKFINSNIKYKPTSSILNCLIKYDKQKIKIDKILENNIWENEKYNNSFNKLNSFFWICSIDLKSSNQITQSIIESWIKKNQSYNSKTWEIDILSKRVISWIFNSKITYEGAGENYKEKFDNVINKQINHLINEINRSMSVNNKLIGCSAIILCGLAYKNDKYLDYGLNLLKKIINSSFENDYFPKTRNLRQLVFYLKYFIFIRDLLKDSFTEIPNHLDEIIFYLGKSYVVFYGKEKKALFNGSQEMQVKYFDQYLDQHGYNFKCSENELGGYAILENKNSVLMMDIGSSPNKKYSENYQSGILSFELSYKGEKLITNCGYFQNFKNELNLVSRSSAAHSTLIVDNKSSCSFSTYLKKSNKIIIGAKILEKKIVKKKNYWNIKASHSGYLENYGIIHERKIEFYNEKFELYGTDKLKKKENFKSTKFDIRFHFLPGTKLTKTQDNKTVLIELKNSGWKFYCNIGTINIDNGLYFGNKNKFVENQNICVTGITRDEEQIINWELTKI